MLSQVTSSDSPSVVADLPTDRLIVKYKDSVRLSALDVIAGSARMQALNVAAGTNLSYDRAMSGDAHVLKLSGRMPITQVQAVAERISKLPEVEYAEPDILLQKTVVPNDPLWNSQWQYSGTYSINLPSAWNYTTGVNSTVVAVIDTGYRPHVDLTDRFLQGYDFISIARVANDGDGRDADAQDPGDWVTSIDASGYFTGCAVENSSWHGTHVAGTIAANTNNGVGVAGVNWQAKILPVRVLGKCFGYLSDIIDGMRWAAGLSVSGVPANTNPAKVLNLSLGAHDLCSKYPELQNAINAVNATGAIIVVAAGNASDAVSNYLPAGCNNVIVVGATTKTGVRAYYSNYGALVDVSAPGGSSGAGILSTMNAGTTTPGADSYASLSGTSMATPHVAGIVSLMVSISPPLNFTRTESILKSTVRAFAAGSDCASMGCGAGVVDAFSAVSMTWSTVTRSKRTYVPFVIQ
jgi:serine protease